jgi:hypothetical protein
MGTTTFSGPVVSNNGFVGNTVYGTSASPVAVTTASNVSSSFVTTSAASGDTRLNYSRLTFTSTGSGETLRLFSVVTGAGAAAAGTINGAHISTSITGSGTISGAANAIRATLGIGASANPGGTIAAIQIDSDFNNTGTVPATAAAIRITNSNTKIFPNMFRVPAPAASSVFRAAAGTPAATHTIPVYSDNGTTYYIMVSTIA